MASYQPQLQWGRDLSVAEGAYANWRYAYKGCFNGAATFRSRKGGSTCNEIHQSTQLQWGRDLSVAEGPQEYSEFYAILRFNGAATFRSRKGSEEGLPHGRDRPASMGPRPFGRGRKHLPTKRRRNARGLQWGRDLSVAEGCRRRAARPLEVFSFNGAATFRSRKVGHQPRQRRALFNASMGPRPFGRGRILLGWIMATPKQVLQWGRDLSVAEGAGPAGGSAGGDKLQWGRDLSVAEGMPIPRAAPPTTSFNGAATFRSRKAPVVRRPLRLPLSFNGAATFRSRKASTSPPAHPPNPSFNGAATFRSRKDIARPAVCGKACLLQWGRDLSVAEGTSRRKPRRGRGLASMGPRPFGRGRSSRTRAAVKMIACFNGAATFRSRKVFQRFRISALKCCFNGAATFRSRKVRLGSRLSLRQQLQWGRDLSVAEGAPAGDGTTS